MSALVRACAARFGLHVDTQRSAMRREVEIVGRLAPTQLMVASISDNAMEDSVSATDVVLGVLGRMSSQLRGRCIVDYLGDDIAPMPDARPTERKERIADRLAALLVFVCDGDNDLCERIGTLLLERVETPAK